MTEQNEKQEEKKETTTTAIMQTNDRGIMLQNLSDMWRFAQYVVNSGFAPKGFEKPEAVLIALEMGAELGLRPMQGLQNIAVVNNRPCIWGDAVPGLVRASNLLKDYSEREIGTYPNDDYGWEIISRRYGDSGTIKTTFTIADAKLAGLWNKQLKSGESSTWQKYPKRMLKMRARTFNLRDNFPDVLKGLYTAEELHDFPMRDGEYEIVEPPTIDLAESLSQEKETKPEQKRRGRPSTKEKQNTEPDAKLNASVETTQGEAPKPSHGTQQEQIEEKSKSTNTPIINLFK